MPGAEMPTDPPLGMRISPGTYVGHLTLILALVWSSANFSEHLGSEPAMEDLSLSFPLPTSCSLPFK